MNNMFYSSGTQLGLSNSPFNGASPMYPSPFADYASTAMPSRMEDVLDMSRYVFHANSPVREAARRLLAYFITDINLDSLDHSDEDSDGGELDKIKQYCDVTLNYRTLTTEIGLDYMGEGNSLISVITPFQRYVACPQCEKSGHYFSVPVGEFMRDKQYKFQWQAPHFCGKCPNCKYSGKWKRTEVAIRDPERIFVKRWNTSEIKIKATPNSRRKVYVWEIPGDYRQAIRRGDRLALEDEPWEFIKAALDNANFEFDDDEIFHLAEPTMASVKTGGWGLPKTFVNFRHVWYWHMLHRMVEAVGADFLLPLRAITPAQTGAGGEEEDDPLLRIDAMGLRGEVEYALRMRRIDPAQWVFLGSPIDYNLLGGDATRLVPAELIDQATATLLNSYGYPIEFWKGSVQTQTAIPAIRMMQAANAPLVYKLAEALTWILTKVAKIAGWEPVRVSFAPPTLVDDIQAAMARVQMATLGLASESEALSGLGMDYKEQQRRRVDDELFKQKQQRRLEEAGVDQEIIDRLMAPPQDPNAPAQQQAAQGGAAAGQPAQPGDPMAAQNMMNLPSGPAPGQKVSLEQLQADGEAIASQLAMQPSGVRQGYMMRLKQRNATLHAQVKASLENLDYQLKAQGGAMLRQQYYGQAA